MTSSQASSSGGSPRKSPRRKRGQQADESLPSSRTKKRRRSSAAAQADESRAKFFQAAMVKYMNEHSLYSDDFPKVLIAVNTQLSGKDTAFTPGEAKSILQSMEEKNLVMFRGGVVHRI